MRRASRRWSERLGAPNGAWEHEDGRYRTLLWRTFEPRRETPPLVFAMLNPSTAGPVDDDATIRRCSGFARRERADGLLVVNVSPYRATDPRDLVTAHRGGIDVLCVEMQQEALRVAFGIGGAVVLAWGAGLPSCCDVPARRLRRRAGRSALCLGLTRTGEPRHPLYLAANAPLRLYGSAVVRNA